MVSIVLIQPATMLCLTGTEGKILFNYCFKSIVDWLKYDSLHETRQIIKVSENAYNGHIKMGMYLRGDKWPPAWPPRKWDYNFGYQEVPVIESSALLGFPLTWTDFRFPLEVPVIGGMHMPPPQFISAV